LDSPPVPTLFEVVYEPLTDFLFSYYPKAMEISILNRPFSYIPTRFEGAMTAVLSSALMLWFLVRILSAPH